LKAENWDKAEYDDGVLERLLALYKELKEKGDGDYWDPETEEYVPPTDEPTGK